MKYLTDKKYIPILCILDFIGSILFFWIKLRQKSKTIRKVLFIRLEHIGDMVMATSTFETFKKNHPDCEVHVLCKKLTAPLIKNNPYVDKIIEYDAPWFIQRVIQGNKKFSEVVQELRTEKYDLVFEMHGDPRNNYLAFRTGAYTVGYSCRGFGFLLNKIIKYDNDIHTIKQNLKLIENFCPDFKTEKTEIFIDHKAKENCKRLMKKYGLENKKFIIINPKSGRKEKDLTDEEVITFINKNKNSKIIITGSKEEMENNKKFIRFKNTIDLTGETDLLTLAELVRNAKKVIAPDTGIVHIAKAVGTEVEAIYKTTDRGVWGY